MSYFQLWAPWRLEYLADQKVSQPAPAAAFSAEPPHPFCFLCKARDTSDDHGHWVVARFEQCFVLLNRYPYNNGHLLVATFRHEGQLELLHREERAELAEVLAMMVELLKETLRPEGFNVGLNLGVAAGAGVPGHLHWHVVPRWSGDTNFMPVIGHTKVIPQSLEALWCLLREQLPAVRARHGL
ncbi:MAG: HIT domain-containing protein [Thermoguttaceae bacterium]|nr:HIT domain-containing protein [Thermoguttaceae bacterium]MDW8079862.1 HIT domain-containing protein [Thermoguttaceae bacterium]